MIEQLLIENEKIHEKSNAHNLFTMPQSQATMNRFIVKSQAQERSLTMLSSPSTANENEDLSTPNNDKDKSKHLSYKSRLESNITTQKVDSERMIRSSVKRTREELPSPIHPTGNDTLEMEISYETDKVSDQNQSPSFSDAEFYNIKVPQNSSEKYGLNMDDDKDLQLPFFRRVYKDSLTYPCLPFDRNYNQYILSVGEEVVLNTSMVQKIFRKAKKEGKEQLEIELASIPRESKYFDKEFDTQSSDTPASESHSGSKNDEVTIIEKPPVKAQINMENNNNESIAQSTIVPRKLFNENMNIAKEGKNKNKNNKDNNITQYWDCQSEVVTTKNKTSDGNTLKGKNKDSKSETRRMEEEVQPTEQEEWSNLDNKIEEGIVNTEMPGAANDQTLEIENTKEVKSKSNNSKIIGTEKKEEQEIIFKGHPKPKELKKHLAEKLAEEKRAEKQSKRREKKKQKKKQSRKKKEISPDKPAKKKTRKNEETPLPPEPIIQRDKKNKEVQKKMVTIETEQDEVNTICSGTTTVFNTKQLQDKVQAPVSIRCQFITEFKQKDVTELQNLVTGNQDEVDSTGEEGPKEKYLVLRKELMKMYNKMIDLDTEATLVTWKEGPFSLITPQSDDEFPDQPEVLEKYFDGILTKKTKGKVYIRLRVHLPTADENSFLESMSSWAKAYNCAFYKCLIQAEQMKGVGWLVYSSNFTDRNFLARFLTTRTGFEWGFRLGPISEVDKSFRNYNKRTKALNAYVPAEKEETAYTILKNCFTAVSPDSIEYKARLLWTTRYIYVEPEYRLTASPDATKLEYFRLMFEQQRNASSRFVGRPSTALLENLDVKLVTKHHSITTLREMILNIRSTRQGTFFNTPLFHAVDFCPDLSQVWFQGNRGVGGQGHIFTFFKTLSSEAMAMMRGLGIYLTSIYSAEVVGPLFTLDYWESVEGWKWCHKKKEFTTPEEKIFKSNIAFDPYGNIIKQMIEDDKQEDALEGELESEDETSSGESSESSQSSKSGTKQSPKKGKALTEDDNKTFRLEENAEHITDKVIKNTYEGVEPIEAVGEIRHVHITQEPSVASSITITTGNSEKQQKLTLENVDTYFDEGVQVEDQLKALEATFELENKRRELQRQQIREALQKKIEKSKVSCQGTATVNNEVEQNETSKQGSKVRSPSQNNKVTAKNKSNKSPRSSPSGRNNGGRGATAGRGRGRGRGRGSDRPSPNTSAKSNKVTPNKKDNSKKDKQQIQGKMTIASVKKSSPPKANKKIQDNNTSKNSNKINPNSTGVTAASSEKTGTVK